MKKLSKYFTTDYLADCFLGAWQRFPVAVVFTVLLSASIIVDIWTTTDTRIWYYTLSFGLGTCLSLAASQWTVAFGGGRCKVGVQAGVVALTLLSLGALILNNALAGNEFYIRYSAIFTALAVAIVFMPVGKGSTLKSGRLYTERTLSAAATYALIALILFIAVFLITAVIDALFSVANHKISATVQVVFCVLLPIVLFIGRIPTPLAEAKPEDKLLKLPAAICLNVLLPVTLVYLVIVYAYIAKILFTWSLPDGQVTWIVTVLLIGAILVIFGVQGYLCVDSLGERSLRLTRLILRVLPWTLIPPTVLMSVAIGYRIGEYGITPSRLYVLTFNIWAYGAVIYMCVRRQARLNILASSFAAIFFITSVFPGLNYYSLGMKAAQDRVRAELTEIGFEELPVDYPALESRLSELPDSVARPIAINLSYLDDWNDHSYVRPLVVHDDKIQSWRLLSSRDSDVEVVSLPASQKFSVDSMVAIPEGYTHVRFISDPKCCLIPQNGKINYTGEGLDINIPVDSLNTADPSDCRVVLLPNSSDGGELFILTQCTYSDSNFFRIEGYLLKK